MWVFAKQSWSGFKKVKFWTTVWFWCGSFLRLSQSCAFEESNSISTLWFLSLLRSLRRKSYSFTRFDQLKGIRLSLFRRIDLFKQLFFHILEIVKLFIILLFQVFDKTFQLRGCKILLRQYIFELFDFIKIHIFGLFLPLLEKVEFL